MQMGVDFHICLCLNRGVNISTSARIHSFGSIDKYSLEFVCTDQSLKCIFFPKVTMSLIPCQLMPGVSLPSIKFFKTVPA